MESMPVTDEQTFPLKEDAPENMRFMSVTDEVSHPETFPLKEEAPENMESMPVTDEVSHPETFPLKEEAPENMNCIVSTPDTSQEVRFWLNEEASLNMKFMLVTSTVFHEDMSLLNVEVPSNMDSMSVTDEVSHLEMSPLKEEEANMYLVLVTPERSGESVALYTMLEAPLNAFSMLAHPMSPHWSIETSFADVASESPRFILERSPVMETWYSPGPEYACDCVPFAVTSSVLPSPQSIVIVPPECTSNGMEMVWGDGPASHVVTNVPAGGLSGTCAKAYPGNSADAARSRTGWMPPAGGCGSGFGTAACPGPSACSAAPVTASIIASVAASANASRAVPFLREWRQKAAPDDPLAECRKIASQLRLGRQVRRKKCRCGAQKAKNKPILPLAGYLIGRKTRFCRIRHKYLIALNRNVAS